jgi:hypothetical protein
MEKAIDNADCARQIAGGKRPSLQLPLSQALQAYATGQRAARIALTSVLNFDTRQVHNLIVE